MARTCSKLHQAVYAKPYSPEATENREVQPDSWPFLRGSAEQASDAGPIQSLFNIWLEECYQNKPYSLWRTDYPNAAYQRDRKALKFLDQDKVAKAFLHCEERKVDKVGCISLKAENMR